MNDNDCIAPSSLTPIEAHILSMLRSQPGHTFSRDELAAAAKQRQRTELSRSVDATVARLRRKLGVEGQLLRTTFGEGYRWGTLQPPTHVRRPRIRLKDIELDFDSEVFLRGTMTVPLTTLEARALRRLIEAQGVFVEAVDVAPPGAAARVVLQLRRKLGPGFIRSVRGRGYALTEPPMQDNRFQTFADEAACVAANTMGLEDVVVYHRNGPVLEQVAAWGHKRLADGTVLRPLRLPVGQGIVGCAAQYCSSVLVTDTRHDRRYVPDLHEARAELATPIVVRNEVIGVLDCEAPTPGAFSSTHQRGLEAVARMLAKACLW